jgi:branched-chain amino acid transport system substrate-binding protein
VLGRDIRLRIEETQGELDNSRAIAEQMAADLDVRIVIGRQFSVNTIPVTPVYERAGIIYITVSSVMRNVIRYGSRYTFRLAPNSEALTKGLAKYGVDRGYERVAALYSRDNYNEEMAYAFRDFAVDQGMTIVYEKSFFENRTNFADIGSEMLEKEIDAIFLSTFVDPAVNLIQTLRSMGVDAPIIGSDALDSDLFGSLAGGAGTGTVVPTLYNPFSKRQANALFVENFRQEYGYMPSTRAAQGYDVIKMLVHAMREEAGSTVPSNVATTLRHMASREGATGHLQFGGDGELLDPAIYIKELQHGEFVLFKDRKQEEEQTRSLNIVNGRIIHRPEKPAESTEAIAIQ